MMERKSRAGHDRTVVITAEERRLLRQARGLLLYCYATIKCDPDERAALAVVERLAAP